MNTELWISAGAFGLMLLVIGGLCLASRRKTPEPSFHPRVDLKKVLNSLPATRYPKAPDSDETQSHVFSTVVCDKRGPNTRENFPSKL